MTIGERIRSIRQSKNITQAKLAEMINVSPSYMNHIESGLAQPSIQYILSLAKALDVRPQDILCDIFTYDDNASTADKIKITVEKLPPGQQLMILRLLEYAMSDLLS